MVLDMIAPFYFSENQYAAKARIWRSLPPREALRQRAQITQSFRDLLKTFYLAFGSSASRKPSPSMLMPSTLKKIPKPGKMDIHQAVAR
jgi:hypothetical protein